MHQSIQNFDIPPPWAHPGHLTVHRARGGGNLNVALKGWGIWTGFISCSDVKRSWVFLVFAGFDGFTRQNFAFVSKLLFQNGLKRSLKVTLRHISLWKACKMFDWIRNLSLRWGSSVLIGVSFERLFCPEGREFEQANLQKFKCPGGLPGGDVELSNWSAHNILNYPYQSALLSLFHDVSRLLHAICNC